jgi:glycerophosphoryl diester phosphodiesterase
MWQTVSSVLTDALRDLRASLRTLVITDLAYKILAFAILTPVASLLIYWFRAGTSDRVVADVDIARFFITTPAGVATLTLGSAMFVAITAIEVGCLMAIGFGRSRGVTLNGTAALRFGRDRAWDVLRLSLHMVLRLIAGLIPFLAAVGVVYLALLREHDINYYLARRPPEFQVALALASLIGIGLAFLLIRTIARWTFALPLVLFEDVHPRKAIRESALRAKGSHRIILATLAVWLVVAVTLVAAAAAVFQIVGRTIAPMLADSLALLLLFLSLLAALGALLAVGIGTLNVSWFAMLIHRLYLRSVASGASTASIEPYAGSAAMQISRRMLAVGATVVVLLGVGIGLGAFLVNRGQTPVLVIAHRGSSATAPENTLAAFRLAADQRTNFIELDVQESADGEVLVVHDADLMKVGGDSTKIWEGTAAHLRGIDIGSSKDASFASERVPTLAEALAVCKGRCKVIVELKSYGHNVRLEERVVEVVEAAGMADSCVFMSLDHDMVNKLKTLRPNWRAGVLVAKALGDLTELKADFLAVEARMATRRFIRRAHRAGKDVYIWTVNDPAWMLVGLSRGVDGLITDDPQLARFVIERRAGMSEAQRFLVAQMIRMGASTEQLERETALRP